MTRKKEPCKNHPQRLTTRRCYYCKAPICSACQHHYAHHLFCSRKCYLAWKRQQLVQKIGHWASKEFFWSLLLILIVFFGLLFYFEHRLDRLEENMFVASKKAQPDSLWFDLDTTVTRASGHIRFLLKGPAHTAVSLWQNEKLVAMKPNSGSSDVLARIPLLFGENRFVLWEHRADGREVLVDSFRITYHSARLQFMAQPLYRVGLHSKYVALTFDAGSTDQGSLNILRILQNKKVHCTFFVTGQFIRRYPHIVRQIISDGHQVGNHTLMHPHLTTYAINGRQLTLPTVTRQFLFRQLLGTDSLFHKITGKHLAPFWRAPYGEFNKQILRWAAEAGFKHVGWSKHCDALDWVADSTSALYRSAHQILEHFLHLEETSGLQGRIILMHLGTDRPKDFPYEIIGTLIDSLRHRGYHFTTVGHLISLKAQEHWARK